MAQFQVPQFIEVEDKIFGPLTLKQFVYVGGGAGLSFVLYKTLPVFIAFPLIGVVAGLSIALAFYKVNNRPFIIMMEAAFTYLTKSKLYLWRAEKVKKKSKKVQKQKLSPLDIPNLSDNKLKDLAWSLDIKENIAKEREMDKGLRTTAGDIENITYGK